MALTVAQTAASISWQQKQTNTPFKDTVQGTDQVSNNFVWSTDAGAADAVLTYSLTIAANTNTDINLQSATNLLNQSVTLVRAYAIQVQPTGGAVIMKPSATDGLNWFFGDVSDTITVPSGGIFNYSNPLATTVSGSAKKLNFANPSLTDAITVQIAIIGGI